jgi:DNA helicase HerA-like ATPase
MSADPTHDLSRNGESMISPPAPPPDGRRSPPGALGRIVATERRPNTPHEFHFWTALDSPIGIGTIVRVEGSQPIDGQIPRIYGVVTDGQSYTDLVTPLHDVIGHDGTPAAAVAAPTDRTEIRLYTAAVLRQHPEEPLQPVPMGEVYLADQDDVAVALRMDSYVSGEKRTAIPVGLYRAGGTVAPVYLDADFLVGPEAAHLNITGVSGLATKTSAVEFLLAALFAHFPAAKGSIAALCFNVKGPDLCFLDQPTSLDEKDREMYRLLGIPPRPFERVRYFAPYTARGLSLNTLRSHADLSHNVTPLTWGLLEVLDYAEVLLNRDDVDAKADALIDFIRERVADKEFVDHGVLGDRVFRVQTFDDLEQWFRELLQRMEDRGTETWRTHHIATIRKVRNRLTNISTRCRGLVTDSGARSDLPWGNFEDRAVYVLDVANLEEDAQDLIFARVITRLREQLERRTLGVNHLVVFVDELNKYAPADGPDTYVRRMLLEIAERGRYLGLVLVGAQQFRSQVHRRLVGNAGTALYGRMDPDELATPGYSVLGAATRTKLATLEKGQLMVRHPHFTQPVFVRFPRPAVLSGREGAERFPQAEEPGLAESVLRSLRALDASLTLAAIEDLIDLYQEHEVLRARDATLRARPRDVKEYFRSQFRRIIPAVPIEAPARAALRPVPLDDPYGD